MIKPIPTDYEAYYRLLTILELRLKSMRNSYLEIKSELDLLADKVIEHFTENWVVDWFEQFLNINASHFGLNHQNTISAMIKYGLIHLKKKDFESAFYLFKDAHQRSTTQYGKDSNQAIFVFETMVDLIKKNDMQLQYEESLVSLYFTYKDLYLDEHSKTKETKAELILQLAGWTTLTGSVLGRPEVITRAESIAIQLPESQRLNAFKSEIYTYFKNAFKENQKHPKATENLNEMMKQFMERFDVSYDAFNAHLVSHEEYGFQNITEAVFTLNDQVKDVTELTEDKAVLETLGRLEHRRFVIERLIDGWLPIDINNTDQSKNTYTNSKLSYKEQKSKLSLNYTLVPFSELDELDQKKSKIEKPEVEKDYAIVRAIPYLLKCKQSDQLS